jgi:hypothetical protein
MKTINLEERMEEDTRDRKTSHVHKSTEIILLIMMTILLKTIYRFNTILKKIPMPFFTER